MAFERIEKHLGAVEALMCARAEQGAGVAGDEPLADLINEHLGTGGKRLRARLALAAADALGHDPATAVPWAAACEMLHNATLVHDDLQDGDTQRRGKPTLWAKYGAAQAINAGDLMWQLPYLLVIDAGHTADITTRLCEALAHFGSVVIRGQSAELGLSASTVTGRAAYLSAIKGKTSALFELPVFGAATLGGCGQPAARAIASPFSALGAMFQLQDDVLDLFGEKGRAQSGSDLFEGKVSALVVEHLSRIPEDRDRLCALLEEARDTTSPTEVDWAIKRFRQTGTLSAVCMWIDELSTAAISAESLIAQPALKDVLLALRELILEPIADIMQAAAVG